MSVKGYVSDGTEQVDGYIKQTPEDPADIVKLTYTLMVEMRKKYQSVKMVEPLM